MNVHVCTLSIDFVTAIASGPSYKLVLTRPPTRVKGRLGQLPGDSGCIRPIRKIECFLLHGGINRIIEFALSLGLRPPLLSKCLEDIIVSRYSFLLKTHLFSSGISLDVGKKRGRETDPS